MVDDWCGMSLKRKMRVNIVGLWSRRGKEGRERVRI